MFQLAPRIGERGGVSPPVFRSQRDHREADAAPLAYLG